MITLSEREIAQLKENLEIAQKALKLCDDLLNPEVFGFAVTAEIRNRARDVIGVVTREPV